MHENPTFFVLFQENQVNIREPAQTPRGQWGAVELRIVAGAPPAPVINTP